MWVYIVVYFLSSTVTFFIRLQYIIMRSIFWSVQRAVAAITPASRGWRGLRCCSHHVVLQNSHVLLALVAVHRWNLPGVGCCMYNNSADNLLETIRFFYIFIYHIFFLRSLPFSAKKSIYRRQTPTNYV